MSKLGSSNNPLKIAIVGAGPSGFYAADALINSELKVEVNLLEKLCAPYGLVRTGVAPDHPLIKKSIEKLSKGLLTIDGNQVVDLGKSNDDLMEENKQLSAALQQKSKKLEQMENDYDDETGDDDEYDLDGEE